jgi:hypothetical protein
MMSKFAVSLGSLELGRKAHVDLYEAQDREHAIARALEDYPECSSEYCEVEGIGELWDDGAQS